MPACRRASNNVEVLFLELAMSGKDLKRLLVLYAGVGARAAFVYAGF